MVYIKRRNNFENLNFRSRDSKVLSFFCMLNLVCKNELKMELQLKQSLVVWSVAKYKMNTGLLVLSAVNV
jgi:hypothetical protein